jgi:hypothetical protein
MTSTLDTLYSFPKVLMVEHRVTLRLSCMAAKRKSDSMAAAVVAVARAQNCFHFFVLEVDEPDGIFGKQGALRFR